MSATPSPSATLFSTRRPNSGAPPYQSPPLLRPRSFSSSNDPNQKSSSPLIPIPTKTLALVALIGYATTPSSASALDLVLSEPANALSLPTWAIHVSSVAEWITAMALVWQYGEKSGIESWKGLSWAMVPLLGGAFCACTWHFFYNSESLDFLVALQGALTIIGNSTMCFAAYRIYKSCQKSSENT
ncbi:hypothetical protein QJS04_geneDACA021158 [Acorus gramineus]|uniref:Ycf49-like protein n=1 Tax=Acorus gramineus TaxID=55184 RepID=A0AAV9ACY9_ACOGR|nr:hypothetical protein QJS04_geneDACA021158 [Acorus gramineus]